MENKEKLINEIHRNLQLMEVDLVNEQPKEFVRKVVNKVTGFGKTPKLNLMQKLDDVIKNNTNVKEIVDNPDFTFDGSRQDFKDMYEIYINDKNNLENQYNLITAFLKLENYVKLIDKTNFLLSGLNITYSQLSELIGRFIKIQGDKTNRADIINDIKIYLNQNGYTNKNYQEVLTTYYELYSKKGSGRSSDLIQGGHIDNLIKLAKNESYTPLFSFWNQAYKTINNAWKKNKSALEVQIIDKYAGYLNDIANAKTPEDVKTTLLAYQKYIDNTYRSYLIQQDKITLDYVFVFANQLKGELNDKAQSLSDIIDELTLGTLGKEYPGFRLTAVLTSASENTKLEEIINILWTAILPKSDDVYRLSKNKIQKVYSFLFKNNFVRTVLFGVFPNTTLLFKLLKTNKINFRNKNKFPIIKLFFNYIALNLIRNAALTVILPIGWAAYYQASFYIRPLLNNMNPDWFGNVSTEELERFERLGLTEGQNTIGEIFALYSSEVTNHLLSTYTRGNDNSTEGKIVSMLLTFITPAEITTFNQSIVGKTLLYIGNKSIGEGATDYKSFTTLFLGSITQIIGSIFKGLLISIGEAFKQLFKMFGMSIAGGTGTQAGGTEVTVSTPTWSYTTAVTFPNVKFIDINFRHDKTKKLIVNGVNIDNFSNVGNKVRFSIRSATTINSVKIIDTSNVTHDIRQR
jgi:hypothetical protein